MKTSCNRWLSRVGAIAALFGVAACAAPTVLNTQWADPQFSAKPIRAILVVGITKDTSNRRAYEDAMVAQLSARGVKATPSYRVAPDAGPVSQEKMQQVVQEAGATGVLLTRVVDVSQTLQVTPGMTMGPPGGYGFGGFYGYYGGMWAGSYSAPSVYTQVNVAADTRLFEAKDFVLVWSGATTTVAGQGSTAALFEQFATLITGALAKDGLI